MGKIAELIDELDNLVHALTLPMPAEIHINALRESLPKKVELLKKAYVSAGGEDFWK